MPQQLALTICIVFVIYLFWVDRKNNDECSFALWIPFTWMFLAGSRSFSAWLNLNQSIDSASVLAEAYQQGNTVDLTFLSSLIVAGVFIVSRRKIMWGTLFKDNKWIWLYFLYCGISITWTDAPFVSFKRLIKDLGNLVMLMVILTDKRPYEAIGVILKRLAFVILPLSVIFIFYYPDMGRGYDAEGNMMYTGVAQQKNGLGKNCLIIGIYFAWYYLLKEKDHFRIFKQENILNFILVVMLMWLLYMSNSATSLACFVIAIFLFLTARMKFIKHRPNRFITLLCIGLVIYIILELAFNINDSIIRLLGRDPTLTSRTYTWEMLTKMVENPLIGTGYMNFWSGERLLILWDKIGAKIIQAHNGYVEQYLNLGYIGVGFIVLIILSGILTQ